MRQRLTLGLTLLAFIPIGLAYGQNGSATLDISYLDALTFLSGIIWAAFGYAVAHSRNGEPFDSRNFISAVIIGLVLASTAQLLGTTVDDVAKYVVVQLLTVVFDKIFGAKAKKA